MRLLRFLARRARFGVAGLPEEIRAALPLEPGERILASARMTRGRYVVATDRALLVPGTGSFARLPWWRIVAARWDADSRTLHVDADADTGLPESTRQRDSLRFPLSDEGSVPEAVRERVQSSIVVSRHVPLVGRAGVRIVARRGPQFSGLRWSTTFDPGVDERDPEIQSAARAALDEVRRQTA